MLTDEAMEHAVCLGDGGGDGDAYEIRRCEATDGGAGWIDAACMCQSRREELVFRKG
jgi:hypothetical protein